MTAAQSSLYANLPRIAFRIRRIYFDQIVAGTKDTEVRTFSTYWCRQMMRLRDDEDGRCGIAVFVCGRDVHRRMIVAVDEFQTAREALGREPSEQGKADIGDGPVLAFRLGEVVE